MQNLHSLQYLYWHYKLVFRFVGAFGFLQMTLPLNKFAHPWFVLCVKKPGPLLGAQGGETPWKIFRLPCKNVLDKI